MNNNETEVYIFGASKGGEHVYDIFTNLNVKVLGFIDNNENKWGSMFHGVFVYAPDILFTCKGNQKIVIASTYHDEIRKQLIEMHIDEDKIVMKDKIIHDVLGLSRKKTENLQSYGDRIIFDLSEGFILSGVVNWSINLIEQLYLDKKDFNVLSMKTEDCNYDYGKIQERIHWIDYDLAGYMQSIDETISYIEENLPCKIIINQISQIFWAACLARQKHEGQIEIVSVIHSDFVRIYEQNVFLDKYIDEYICVSKDIKKNLRDRYNIDEKKLNYRETSIEFDKDFKRKYKDDTKIINIAYAARLEKAQKRTDLLLPLMELLNKSGIEYKMNIAGTGTYHKKLEEYIRENKLTDKVKMYGRLSYDEMKVFWKENDIFINLSDIEGMPVSMLEAMSWGVVPIVTRTSGINETVNDGVNGYVCDIGNIEGIFNKIQVLNSDRNKLRTMSGECRKRVELNHDRKKYLDFLLEV